MASCTCAGIADTLGGNMTTGRNRPNVMGPETRSDTYMPAGVPIRSCAWRTLAGSGSRGDASRRSRRKLYAPMASHNALAAMPAASPINTRSPIGHASDRDAAATESPADDAALPAVTIVVVESAGAMTMFQG
jgi:hypothetical protein